MAVTIESTIGQLVAERPARARVFQGFEIDFCCGGGKTVADACRARGISPKVVLDMIAIVDEGPARDERDWTKASITELCDNIESTHHDYLKRELPRLEFMARKVADRHGGHSPHLVELRDVFLHTKAELEGHMRKEEQILFPICRQMDRARGPFAVHCGSVQNPIRVMIQEHDDAGDALSRMRALTGGYVPPSDACNTYRAYFDGLAEFERDMHRHVHKENSVLFPKAVEAELALRNAGAEI
jgi:regulator of cell morphogenesis and NO signaling